VSMSSTLFVFLCAAFCSLLFNVIYFNIVCIYIHTSIRYQLFALRDRLRRIRIDYPSVPEDVYSVMELCINGSIGLVSNLSVRNIFIASFTCSPNKDDLEKIRNMERVMKGIERDKETGTGQKIFEIETERSKIFERIIRYNSPYFMLFAAIYRWIKPLLRVIPAMRELVRRYNEQKTEAVPIMVIRAAYGLSGSA
jgi:hypothetical protein